jgi:hypothetical protein
MPKPIAARKLTLRSIAKSCHHGRDKYIALFEGFVDNTSVSFLFHWDCVIPWESVDVELVPFAAGIKYGRDFGLVTYEFYPLRRQDESCVLPVYNDDRPWENNTATTISSPRVWRIPGSTHPMYTSPTSVRESYQHGGDEFLFVKEITVKFPRYCPGDDMSDLGTRLSCLVTPYVGTEWPELLATPPPQAYRGVEETVYISRGCVDFRAER